MSELAPSGTPVGTVLAAAVNQTIFYSIVGGNDIGMQSLHWLCKWINKCFSLKSEVDIYMQLQEEPLCGDVQRNISAFLCLFCLFLLHVFFYVWI